MDKPEEESLEVRAGRMFRAAGFLPSTPGQQMEALSKGVSDAAAEWAQLAGNGNLSTALVDEVRAAFADLQELLAMAVASTPAEEEASADDDQGGD